jgi:hypothetical protein
MHRVTGHKPLLIADDQGSNSNCTDGNAVFNFADWRVAFPAPAFARAHFACTDAVSGRKRPIHPYVRLSYDHPSVPT